jgi:hypothetical protein
MAKAFNTVELLAALDDVGATAVAHREQLTIAVYGGSALMLASNFRFSSEDVDIAPLEKKPAWLDAVIAEIGKRHGWDADWMNDAVGFFLSASAGSDDHVFYGTFPRNSGSIGLKVFVPSAEYMLALKLKALRLTGSDKATNEQRDIQALMRVCDIKSPEDALNLLARYFPISAAAPEKLMFLLKHVLVDGDAHDGAPEYPRPGR